MKDITGMEVEAGQYVVYAASAGRSGIMKAGRVVEVVPEHTIVNRNGWNEKKEERAMVVTCDKWGGGNFDHYPDGWDLQNKGKPVRLTFGERICILPISRVPPILKGVLDGTIAPLNKDGRIMFSDGLPYIAGMVLFTEVGIGQRFIFQVEAIRRVVMNLEPMPSWTKTGEDQYMAEDGIHNIGVSETLVLVLNEKEV